MINVAVSRAKREFHAITGNQWLPGEYQQSELGYDLSDGRDFSEYYFKKLNDYTYRRLKERGGLSDGCFGFHRSEITSVFDTVPRYRELCPETGEISAPERCMRRALLENLPEDYKVYREVPLGEIFRPEECESGEVREYVENSRIDFRICKGGEALLAIEVDGAQHRRADPEQENCDSLKDCCFEKMSGEIEYLRISTAGADGTYQSEVDNIRRLCAKAEKFNKRRRFDNSGGRAIEADAEELKDGLAMYLRSFLENDCLDGVKNFYREHGGVPQLEYLSYNSIQDIDYGDAATNQYYFCKFGLAYAFEYSLLYEIMLRIADTDQFGVNSFGCGGYIDAWALAYS